MRPTLALFEDVFQNDAAVAAPLPARPRVAFVVHGAVTIAGRAYGDGEAWCGEDAIAPRAGAAGATVWRWELAAAGQMPESAPGLRSLPKLAVPLVITHPLVPRRHRWCSAGMRRDELERLSKDELIELVLRLQRPAKTSRTSVSVNIVVACLS